MHATATLVIGVSSCGCLGETTAGGLGWAADWAEAKAESEGGRAVTTGLPDPQLRSLASPPFLISMSDIVAFARVKRPVVSTWRRRHPDFPVTLSESSGRSLFDSAQVAEWLIASGLGNAAPSELRWELALFGTFALRERFAAWRLVETAGSLLRLRGMDGRPLVDPEEEAGDAHLWAGLLRRAERIDIEDEFALREVRAIDAAIAPAVLAALTCLAEERDLLTALAADPEDRLTRVTAAAPDGGRGRTRPRRADRHRPGGALRRPGPRRDAAPMPSRRGLTRTLHLSHRPVDSPSQSKKNLCRTWRMSACPEPPVHPKPL
jgi:hypothetical protein